MSNVLCAFRQKYSCELLLVKLIEDWKALLDQHQVVGAMMLDLSKAFDCLPHRLLLAKLSSYGFDSDACNLIKSYLSQRTQRVKIGDCRSQWRELIKGVPQGSILGPLIFNIFINDIFYILDDIYNYADDNTISRHGANIDIVKSLLEDATRTALRWFDVNETQANPDKFQALVLGLPSTTDISFNVNGCDIFAQDSVELLGIEVDNRLNFDNHIAKLSSNAALQLNALRRLSHSLDYKTKSCVFNSFILSNFNYCPLVWHHCSIQNLRRMEKLQERGLRLILKDNESTYSELLSKAKRNYLYIESLKKIALLVFKSTRNCGPPLINDLFDTKEMTYSLRDNDKVTQPKVESTTFGLGSLRYSGAALWNKLPIDIKTSIKFSDFKSLLKAWDGPECSCGLCKLCRIK